MQHLNQAQTCKVENTINYLSKLIGRFCIIFAQKSCHVMHRLMNKTTLPLLTLGQKSEKI